MKKINIKITQTEFWELLKYCENINNYFLLLDNYNHTVSNIVIFELYEQIKLEESKVKYMPKNQDYRLKIRLSEARSLAENLINWCPNYSLQTLLNKLDFALTNNHQNLKHLLADGTQNQVFC